MEDNRTIQALLISYSMDTLSIESEIEFLVNDRQENLKIKTIKLKKLIKKLIAIEYSIVKIKSMINNNDK